MTPATKNNANTVSRFRPADDFMSLQDLLRLCLANWKWFALSLAVCLCAAAAYLLTTPPVYTRSASILVKADSKGQSVTDAAGVLGNIDIFQTNTNVNNELISMQSPAVMLDVVKRLDLDVDYTTDGNFYRRVLYGSDLPVKVSFLDLRDNETASMTMRPEDGGKWKLSGFTRNGEEADAPESVTVTAGVPARTPAGRVLVEPADGRSAATGLPIYVSRSTIAGTTASYASRLTAALNSEEATVIDLSFQDVNIQRAEEVLNTLIAVYNENWVKDKNQIAVSTSMFINDRLSVIEQELGHVDENISSYKSANLLPDVQAASSLYMSQSSETNAQIMELNTQLSMARYIRNYMTASGNRGQLLPANTGLQGGNVEQQISEYNAMQLQRNNLVANSSESNPLVTDMDHSLSALHDAIISSIDNLIVSLNTQIASLERSEAQTTARIAANPGQAKHLLSVERQQKVKEQLYLFLLQKREENELSQAFTAYNTRVITPPCGPDAPTAPNGRNVLLAAFALGLILPASVLFVRENSNTRVRGKKDVEAMAVPFAGEIPLVGGRRRRLPWRKEEAVPGGLVVRKGGRDAVNEAFRVLRTNFEFMAQGAAAGNTVMVTSMNPGSGKTFVTANLAASLAVKGERVVAVDLDLRRASLSRYVGSPGTGLSGYLAGQELTAGDITVGAAGCPGLDVIPVGAIPPNPSELLLSGRLERLLGELRGKYDHVLLDCPPDGIVADAAIIARQAASTLFVVRAGMMERNMLPEVDGLYAAGKYNGMALVLNATENTPKKYGYRYGYGDNSYYGSAKE